MEDVVYYRHDPFGRRVVRETTVPRKLAEEIARERDLYRRELERVQRENEALRQRLVEQAQTREQEQPLPPEPRPRTLEIEEEAEEVRAVEQSELEREHAVAVKRAQELLEDLERLQRKQEDELTARARRARRETVSAYLELRDNLSRAIALARDHGSSWSDGMEALRDQWACDLPLGSGAPVPPALRRFLKLHGRAELGQVAKLHFANVKRIAEGLPWS